jgi:phage N-6-adenine-methyltransferase
VSLVRFKGANHPQQIATRGVREDIDSRATSWEVFNPLQERFAFTLDAAASPENAKLPRFVTTVENGLERGWGGERVWCNPPYSSIGAWVAKAWREWRSTYPPAVIVMLLPANRCEQGWWQHEVEQFRDRAGSPLRTEFIAGRIRFIRNGAEAIFPNERPPFGCVLLIWERA